MQTEFPYHYKMPSSHSGRLHRTCNADPFGHVGSNPTEGSSRKLSNNILAYGIDCIKLQMNE